MFEQIGKSVDNSVKKAWNWVTDEQNRDNVKLIGIMVGALVIYWKSFDYGYAARVNLEKAVDAQYGSKIVETLKHFE